MKYTINVTFTMQVEAESSDEAVDQVRELRRNGLLDLDGLLDEPAIFDADKESA